MTKPTRSLAVLEEERAVPWGDGENYAWHRARYEYAAGRVAGLRVLDVGSGEGYGAALLAESAAEVLGVDYSPAAVAHAAPRYLRPNLRYEVLDARELETIGPARFDVATCFEVVEHLEDADALVCGLAHVLAPRGLLLLSTPNNALWRAPRSDGAYHVNNLAPRELRRLLEPEFEVVLLGQVLRGSTAHGVLKAADIFNLRHRLIRSRRLKRALAGRAGGPPPVAGVDTAAFEFSRRLVRQAQDTLAVARRRGG